MLDPRPTNLELTVSSIISTTPETSRIKSALLRTPSFEYIKNNCSEKTSNEISWRDGEEIWRGGDNEAFKKVKPKPGAV